MNIKILALFFFIFFVQLSISKSQDLTEYLIAYWSFDDSTAVDNSGNGYDGTLVNNPTPDIGVKGACFRFKGKDAYIEVNQNKNLIGDHIIIPRIPFENYSEFTVSMWVNEEKLEFVGGAGYLFFGEVFNAWAGIYHAGHYPDPTLWIKFSTGSINDEDEPLKLDYWPIFNDTWMFYAMVYKNDTLYAYFNGQKIGQKYQPLMISGNRAGIATNWWYYSSEHRQSAAFTGRIDEVKIYKRALTDDEIEKEANNLLITFELPDTVGIIGENICLPLTISTPNENLQIDSLNYKVKVSYQKSVLWPNDDNLGLIVGKNREFELVGTIYDVIPNTPTIINVFCGNILLAEQKTTELVIEDISISDSDFTIKKEDGSLTINGICRQELSRIKSNSILNASISYNANDNNVLLEANLSEDTELSYSIFNIFGQELNQVDLEKFHKGKTSLHIETINLSSGIYFIKIKSNSNMLIEKFCLTR